MTEYGNYVNGEWTESGEGETFGVVNPADNTEVVAQFQNSTTADVETAIEDAVNT
ncbi:hypothetical protein [Halopelagius fulvigenes]|uniref:Aldehyde dehydrogenase family protein n=1 Tax=Halopelagius fulvigenes TaxID=1198324 RepID=A0ABD5TXL1_9EURY